MDEKLFIDSRSPIRRSQLLLPWLSVEVLKTNPAVLFAFLQSHISTASPKEKARLDQALYWRPSDLSTCHEMLVSVRLNRPQNKFRTLDDVKKSENREVWQASRLNPDASQRALENAGAGLIKDFFREKVPGGPKNMAWLT